MKNRSNIFVIDIKWEQVTIKTMVAADWCLESCYVWFVEWNSSNETLKLRER